VDSNFTDLLLIISLNMHRLTEYGRTIFKIAAMMSFHAEWCCHLVSAHAASVRRICSSVRHSCLLNRILKAAFSL